jgi:1-phosphofructokinase family hexose kinase
MILTITLNPAVDFTVFGEDFKVGRTNRCRDVYPDPGGKGNNAARIARCLGSEVMATGFLGGFTGDFIEKELEREGIRTAFYKINDLTRITVSHIDRSQQCETKVVPYGPKILGQQAEAFISHIEELIIENDFSIIAVCGSLAKGLDEDYYARLISLAKMHDTPVILDSSGTALRMGVEACPFMIKPNIEEAAELAGAKPPEEIIAFLQRLTSKIRIISLTMGGEGVLFITSKGIVKAKAEDIKSVNQVGAGDAFIGGFLAAYDRYGYDENKLFTWSTAAGASTAQSSSLLWPRGMFEQSIEKVVISK